MRLTPTFIEQSRFLKMNLFLSLYISYWFCVSREPGLIPVVSGMLTKLCSHHLPWNIFLTPNEVPHF